MPNPRSQRPESPRRGDGRQHSAGEQQSPSEYSLLELLLTCVIPQLDIVPRAKRLLAEFGALQGVLSADVEMLCYHMSKAGDSPQSSDGITEEPIAVLVRLRKLELITETQYGRLGRRAVSTRRLPGVGQSQDSDIWGWQPLGWTPLGYNPMVSPKTAGVKAVGATRSSAIDSRRTGSRRRWSGRSSTERLSFDRSSPASRPEVWAASAGTPSGCPGGRGSRSASPAPPSGSGAAGP